MRRLEASRFSLVLLLLSGSKTIQLCGSSAVNSTTISEFDDQRLQKLRGSRQSLSSEDSILTDGSSEAENMDQEGKMGILENEAAPNLNSDFNDQQFQHFLSGIYQDENGELYMALEDGEDGGVEKSDEELIPWPFDMIDHNESDQNSSSNNAIRQLQLTSVQSFINSYQSGTRFNDTTITGVTGVVPPGRPVAQVTQQQGVAGALGPGVISSGGAATGTTGIAGAPFGGLAGQPGVGTGGVGIGGASTGAGTTAGTIGGAPGGSGVVGPSGLPAPVAAPGGVGGVGAAGGGLT